MLKAETTGNRLSDDQRIDWLRLIRTENVGPVSFRQLLNRFGSVGGALDALPRLSTRGGRSTPLTPVTRAQAEDEIAGTLMHGAHIVAMGEPEYPHLLRQIPAAPPMITIKGGTNLDWGRTLGIVGARNASAAGQRMTKILAGDLGERGYVIVSGLARGIDAAAHTASLETGTVAALAGGLDCIYPEENAPLADAIVEHGGALVTEMPLGWAPRSRDFPRRNRLVSGLSLGIIVIEAAKRSGSLITARKALEQNREVFAVPGSPLDPRSEGANSIIQQGAMLVTCAEDIIDNLGNFRPAQGSLFEDDDLGGDIAGMGADMTANADDASRELLLSALSMTPTSVDELVQQTGIAAPLMQVMLMELDLAGRVEWASGQLVSLKE